MKNFISVKGLEGGIDLPTSRACITGRLQKNQLDTLSKQLAVLRQTNEEKLHLVRETIQNRFEIYLRFYEDWWVRGRSVEQRKDYAQWDTVLWKVIEDTKMHFTD